MTQQIDTNEESEAKITFEDGQVLTVRGDKGDKGDTGEKGDTPIKGKDYFDGKDGEKGEPGKDGSPDTPLQIAEKINTLEKEISFKVLKDVPEIEKISISDIIKELKDPKSKNRLERKDIKGMPLDMSDQRWHGGGGNTVKIADTDTTAGYLKQKLVAGDNILITQNNIGGNETLTIEANASINDQFDIVDWVNDEDPALWKYVLVHNLDTLYPTVEVRQLDIIIFTTVIIIDSNTLKIIVSKDPDLRFTGKINVIKI